MRNWLPYITKIHARFSVFDKTSVGVREFLRQVNAPKCVASNPKCEVSQEVLAMWDASPPSLTISFVNDTTQTLTTNEMVVDSIIEDVETTCTLIENDYMAKGIPLPTQEGV